jgi:hypothetical protein
MTSACRRLVSTLTRCVASGRAGVGGQQLVAREHQLSGEIHQPVETLDVHAHARVGERGTRLAGCGGRLPGIRGGRRCAASAGCARERVDQSRIIDRVLGAGALDRREQRAHAIDRGKQRGRGCPVERGAVADACEQALARVGERTEPDEAKKAARALERVERTERASERSGGARVALERQQIVVELPEVLVGLEEELLEDALVLAHGGSFATRGAAGA